MSDHIQKVMKPNFAAAWEEVGDTFEKERLSVSSSTKTLEGENTFLNSVLPDNSLTPNRDICYSRRTLL